MLPPHAEGDSVVLAEGTETTGSLHVRALQAKRGFSSCSGDMHNSCAYSCFTFDYFSGRLSGQAQIVPPDRHEQYREEDA